MKRLLVVDDEPDVCEFVGSVGTETGFSADSAGNYEQFLAVYRPDAFHVIVVDLVIPGTSGTEFLQILARDRCRAGIVLVSGADLQVLSAAERFASFHGLTVLGTLAKPIMVHELMRLLAKAS